MEDIMSKNIITVNIDSTLQEISDIMKKYDIGFVPVSDKNKIIGVLTDRDIVVKILANNDNKIKGYLSSPISIDINQDTNDALKLMRKHKIKRLLVKDNNKLVGILSISDLLNNINIFESIKEIFEIDKNSDKYNTKINEFYL